MSAATAIFCHAVSVFSAAAEAGAEREIGARRLGDVALLAGEADDVEGAGEIVEAGDAAGERVGSPACGEGGGARRQSRGLGRRQEAGEALVDGGDSGGELRRESAQVEGEARAQEPQRRPFEEAA